jgi:glycosyltransferase involved in cell wall biosynthesis
MSYLLRPEDEVHWIPQMSRAVSLFRDLAALFGLYHYLRRTRPDIVHTHTAKAGALGRIAARLAGVPAVVHTFHGNVLDGYFPAPAAIAIRCVERFLGRLTDAICVLSPQQSAELSSRLGVAGTGKVHIVPFGLDLAPYHAIPPAPPGGRLIAGWLGRLVPIKNVPLLVSVMRESARLGAPVEFVIAGDGPERPLVEAAAAELGPARCRFLGWQRQVEPVLAQCHLLIQTSRNEGTPVALIQGMAASRPFVSTPAGGVVDMVTGAGRQTPPGSRWFDNGILSPPDPGAFAATLAELARQPGLLDPMGRAAAHFAVSHYSLEALTGALDRIYRGLLAESPEGRLLCTRWSSLA